MWIVTVCLAQLSLTFMAQFYIVLQHLNIYTSLCSSSILSWLMLIFNVLSYSCYCFRYQLCYLLSVTSADWVICSFYLSKFCFYLIFIFCFKYILCYYCCWSCDCPNCCCAVHRWAVWLAVSYT